MKNRIGIILLALICVGLGIGLLATKKQADKRQVEDEARVEALSNKWVKTSNDLDEQRQVSAMLEKDVEKQKQNFAELTNTFSRVSGQLTLVSGNLAQTEATAETLPLASTRALRMSDRNMNNPPLVYIAPASHTT